MSANSDLTEKLGYVFRDEGFLARALTHASINNDDNYERLEFLGDRVMGLAVAALLLEAFPQDSEGDLAKRHTALVQQAALVDVARALCLPDKIKSLEGAATEAVIADAVEAIIGAIFLDGGYDAAEKTVQKLWRGLVDKYKAPPVDPKSRLQEWAQEKGLPLPVYSVASQSGSDHAPVFDIDVTIKGYAPVRATANSKRAGEKEAAHAFLKQLGIV